MGCDVTRSSDGVGASPTPVAHGGEIGVASRGETRKMNADDRNPLSEAVLFAVRLLPSRDMSVPSSLPARMPACLSACLCSTSSVEESGKDDGGKEGNPSQDSATDAPAGEILHFSNWKL